MKYKLYYLILLFIGFTYLQSCNQVNTPKPRAFFRIQYPEHHYKTYDSICPFIFAIPSYSRVVPDDTKYAEPCWLNVEFIPFNAKLHLSYKTIASDNELFTLAEDARELVYKHTVKAEEIIESIIDTNKNYGMFYELKGNTATSIQFYISDSTAHYLRGSLYFTAKVNRDSLQPVIDFLKTDIQHLVNTLQWKYK